MRRPVRRVTKAEIRRLFNDGDYYGRMQRNEILATVESDRLAPSQAGQPAGTRSQTLWYFDAQTLERLAFVHQYVLPDGSIGGSGRPDPKRLLLDDEILIPFPDLPH